MAVAGMGEPCADPVADIIRTNRPEKPGRAMPYSWNRAGTVAEPPCW